MKQPPVVAIFGISGVGKSWLIERYAEDIPVLHVVASQLLRDAKTSLSGEKVTSEDLRKGAVVSNQALLIKAFSHVRNTATQPIIFDGHCIVDDGVELIEIPAEVIVGLQVSHLVFIEGSAKGIAMRRQNDLTRERPVRSEAELTHHQRQAKAVCEAYSKSLGLPLIIVKACDEEAFACALMHSGVNRASCESSGLDDAVHD